jgi:hypothetical protein
MIFVKNLNNDAVCGKVSIEKGVFLRSIGFAQCLHIAPQLHDLLCRGIICLLSSRSKPLFDEDF